MLLVPALVNKNNLHASFLLTHILTKNTYDHAYFKDVTNSFLPAAALLSKHRARDQDTLIQQSFICDYQQINGSAISKDNKQE